MGRRAKVSTGKGAGCEVAIGASGRMNVENCAVALRCGCLADAGRAVWMREDEAVVTRRKLLAQQATRDGSASSKSRSRRCEDGKGQERLRQKAEQSRKRRVRRRESGRDDPDGAAEQRVCGDGAASPDGAAACQLPHSAAYACRGRAMRRGIPGCRLRRLTWRLGTRTRSTIGMARRGCVPAGERQGSDTLSDYADYLGAQALVQAGRTGEVLPLLDHFDAAPGKHLLR